jgi:hypothetical protein
VGKKAKVFLKAAYWIFTFGLGVVLAFIMPGITFYEDLAVEMNVSLEEGRYTDAMKLIGGYYDEEYVHNSKFTDDGGIVIFKAATLLENTKENATQLYTIRNVYSIFLYNVKNKYIDSSQKNNEAHVVVTDGANKKTRIEVLNYDADGDTVNDSISTLVNFTYVYFEIAEENVQNIKKIDIINSSGILYQSVEVNLDFEDQFFVKLRPFINEYNKNSGSNALQGFNDSFLALDDSYKMGNHDEIYSNANKKATGFILFYFIWIYILGDFLVGKRYILSFFVWLYRKIRKIEKVENDKNSVYGTDYYSNVTFNLIVPNGCDINVSVTYHNETNEIELLFTKDNNYTVTKRIRAGTYVNAWLECPGYETINLPKTLNVRGYKMTVDVTLNKTESKLDTINEEKEEANNENSN